ncbi:amino acid transporter [Lentzea tibetensis]|uniref:Amino acid transporter n=1 Tax=Lentzea tibetensis TaxID=2591470 RepID=A0A563EU61_9PSEU|nr:amino acid transporter [Lentzea tibetensis]TWP51267.1 amino acid transporter [Lentzea tibetensis]
MHHWGPAPLEEVAELFSGFGRPWWVAGGMAIELAVGRAFREHGDVDVVVLRCDHVAVLDVLRGWELWAADPPGTLRPWLAGELPQHVHDVWCRPGPDAPWRLQVMIDESDGDWWVSRRDPAVRRPLSDVVKHGVVPYLASEVQLYYKSRSPRAKDEQDFAAVREHLTDEQRAWLRQVLGPGHHWT